eukprot:TRINITY_DN93050_c0_g1_i1.p1 TRINITY_DN93050_c0_g1~~TRINITY_DN93050_c0_g1_i1.p1  ORF type:complete len:299 (-),score=28.43 TRINITY_DN93050_c0_g1_i1:421-1317(-)
MTSLWAQFLKLFSFTNNVTFFSFQKILIIMLWCSLKYSIRNSVLVQPLKKRSDIRIPLQLFYQMAASNLKTPKVALDQQLRENSLKSLHPKADHVLKYWFGDDFATLTSHQLPKKEVNNKWFSGGEEGDKEIHQLFSNDLLAVKNGQFAEWKENPLGALALLLYMDQFTRTVYRGSAEAFSMDQQAIELATQIVQNGNINALLPIERLFVALPFEHHESIEAQEFAIDLLKTQIEICRSLENGDEAADYLQYCLGYAEAHRDVIAKWGRFPHRNKLLGRESTPEELEGFQKKLIPSFG